MKLSVWTLAPVVVLSLLNGESNVRAEPTAGWVPLASLLPGVPAATVTEREDDNKQSKQRAKLRTLHRAFGITTWVSLGATNFIGTARYANVVGFGTPLCESGSPIFGETWGCGNGLRYQHLASATFTTLSYATTRVIGALMPDPYAASEGDDAHATKLRWHKALSWVHLVGMVAMPVLGFATSSTDGETRDALATAHLVTGWTTFAAVSVAGSLMVF